MNNLYSEDFEPSSSAAWKQKIQFELQGADYNKTLLKQTLEGISIKPFYHSDSFQKLNSTSKQNTAQLCEPINIDSEINANKKALFAIKNGANAIKFNVKNSFNSTILFDNLLNKNITFHFNFHFLNEVFLTELIQKLENEVVFYNIDIIGNLAKTGNWHSTISSDFNIIENLLKRNASTFILGINSNIYQNAGANNVQQIAYTLAHVNEYLTKFGANIASKIQFNFSIGSNFFFEIAKIKAFRYLYNLILQKYNISANAIIFCEPTKRNKTKIDLKTNIIRSTNECLSASIGGSNTVSTFLFDNLFTLNNTLSEKVSKNQLLILKKKCNIENIQNIAEEASYIESLSVQIAEKSLAIFKDIEKSGGFLSQLKNDTIQRKINENAQKEQTAFNNGTIVLTDIINLKKHNTNKPSKNKLKAGYKTLITPIIEKRLTEKLEH
ncbi:methylmalonyl-CoA mutase family protein [uncultured Lutibacter sp.]|uniref:methylmalonyl-CoA mutase family protein n=1 Tax=uncultured Lutibacter sp. TaxID=437739 RepID=UPI0026098920|nr:methylmalonyl-CoA mutase family protein [uncultured Lutibacter sp.]